jgi:hypothetical protein
MKIVSDNPKILDELSSKFEGQKVQESCEDGGMGVLETIAIILGIGVSLIKIYEFLEKHFPDWKIVFVPFQNGEIEMSAERYDAMSDNAKQGILKNYKIIIKRK